MFTSTATSAGAGAIRRASSAYSATLPPAMLTTARASCSASQGRSCARNASTPGFCRPIELSMPLGVSAIRGVGRPARGRSVTDLVTTAPSVDTGANGCSSRPAAAHPDAVSTGLGSTAPARSVVIFTG